MSGWIMVAGGVGALLATEPLAALLLVMSWRGVFVLLAVATLAAAAMIYLLVPDATRPTQGVGLGAQWRGVRRVFADARFWWIGPFGAACMGSFMAVQGLWSVPWLVEVDGYTREVAARHLLVMGLAILAGYAALGAFATRLHRRGIGARHLFAVGFTLSIVAFALINARWIPYTYLLWTLYGLGASVNVLAFAVLSEGFPRELSARASTALNLLMFMGSFVSQWGIGVVVDAAKSRLGMDAAQGLRLAFAIVLALQLVTLAWFLLRWRRHAGGAHASSGATP
jgi:predicted MFS family arabinose efflux permease